MLQSPRNRFNASPEYQPILREIGLDAEAVFTRPDIFVWRSITERENCTLDAELSGGRKVRLHIKRYHPARGLISPADEEAQGIRALMIERIPTVPLIGWGTLIDGRSFVISEDLYGYQAGDKAVEGWLAFEQLLIPTADLTAKLHRSGLHHRDLYLCHFFVKHGVNGIELALIDAARVKRLPGWPMRSRWIVKDLSQFWYSTTKLSSVTEEQRLRWLKRYADQAGIASIRNLLRRIQSKVKRIARHENSLKASHTGRDVSILH